MGELAYGAMKSGLDPQKVAANKVVATPNSSPSLGQMQEGMGGLVNNETQQEALGGLLGNLEDKFGSMFGGLIETGQQAMQNHPMLPFLQQMGIATPPPEKPVTSDVPPPKDPVAPQPPVEPPAQQMSAYDQRIQELMQNRGWSRQAAMQNQREALGRGADFNKDGAVSNDEWYQFKNPSSAKGQEQSTRPAHQSIVRPLGQWIADHPHAPQQEGYFSKMERLGPRPTNGMGQQQAMPGGPNLTPEQLAAMQKMQGYRGGMR